MEDTEFIAEFSNIMDQIARSIEEQDNQDLLDVDINGDILNISAKQGLFVINKQTFLQEIWLSSPISGPHHFSKKGQSWCNRDNQSLLQILSRELLIDFS